MMFDTGPVNRLQESTSICRKETGSKGLRHGFHIHTEEYVSEVL
jgi:hypothetical protein